MDRDKYNNQNKPIKKIKKVVAPIITTTDLPIEDIKESEPIIESKTEINDIELTRDEPDVVPIEVEPVKKQKIVKRIVKKKIPKTQSKMVSAIKHHEVPLGIVKIISLLVSLIAIVRTFAYDYLYYLALDHPFFALLLAALLVMVSFTSPQVMIYAWKRRNILVGLISLAFVVLSSYYSIFVTKEIIRLKRNTNNIELSLSQEEVIRARERVKEINVLESQLFTDREIELRERNSLQLASEKLIDERKDNTWEYNSMRTRLIASKDRIDSISNRITELQEERKELQNVDGFYSQHVKTEDEKNIESSRDLVFAIFLDFTGPVFMAFSLFL
ncbi:MAG: hypothetical protein AB7V16_11870 [Vulcanibacillus sp.]